MELLFSPCTRYRNLEESQGRVPPEWLRELNLDVPTDEFLSTERGFTYADLYAMLGNGDIIAWLTPHAAVMHAPLRVEYYWKQQVEWCHIYFTVDGKEIVAWARSSAALSEICDVLLRLLVASVVHSVILRRRPDLEIELASCQITRAGASVLAEVLASNQGPTRLDNCTIDTFIIADGLRGNSRLETFSPHFSGVFDSNRQVLALADAIRENKGLAEWRLRSYGLIVMNDETWNAVCDSLKTHPTLEILNLGDVRSYATTTPAVIMSRIQALLGMMVVNTSIHTIHLSYQYNLNELFRESVIPYLEKNRLRPHVRAIQKTLPITYRAKDLGRALLAVRTDPNRFWMLISGNAEVAFPSMTATTTRAVSLPTPAIAATTSNAPAVAATTIFTTDVFAVDIVATPPTAY